MPALFVAVGCVLMLSGINSIFDKKLPDLSLNLSKYNPYVKTQPNPILYNQDGQQFQYNMFQVPPSDHPEWGTSTNLINPNVTGQDVIMSVIPHHNTLPIVGLNAPTILNMSLDLLSTRTAYAASRYGAFSFGLVTDGVEYRYNAHVNYTGAHASAIFQNIMNDAILRSIDPTQSITAVVKPLAVTKHEISTASSFNGFPVVIMIMLAFAFIPAAFALFVVRERETKAKHLQVSFCWNLSQVTTLTRTYR